MPPVLAPQTLAVGEWTELGPRVGGRLDGIVVVESLDRTERLVMVASPGGGVWRRHVSEVLWRRGEMRGLGDLVLVDLQRDVSDPQRVFGVGWNRVYETTDNGDTWRFVVGPTFARPLPTNSGLIDRGNPFAQLPVAGGGRFLLYAPPCGGICVSDEDGDDFECTLVREDEPSHLDNCVGNIAVDEAFGYVWVSTLYPSLDSVSVADTLAPTHLYRSALPCAAGQRCPPTGLGHRWVEAFDTDPPYTDEEGPIRWPVAAMVAATPFGAAEPRIVAVSRAGAPPAYSYETVPGTVGLRWRRTSDRAGSGGPRRLLYAGEGDELILGNVRPFHSPDSGRTWVALPFRNLHDDCRALWLEPVLDEPARLWTATDGGNALGQAYNVATWRWSPGATPAEAPSSFDGILPNDLAVWQTQYAVPVILPGGRRRVLVGGFDNTGGCFDDATGIATWDRLVDGVEELPGSADFLALVADASSGRAYMRFGNMALMRTDDFRAASCRAIAWEFGTDVPLQIPRRASRDMLAIHPADSRHVYTIGANGVVVSRDGGDTWDPVRPPPAGASPSAIAVDERGTIVLGTEDSGAWMSRSEGRSWQPFGLNRDPPDVVYTIVRGRPLRGAVRTADWLGTSQGLYRRSGLRWQRVLPRDLPEDFPFAVSAIAVDPRCASRIYAGVGYGGEELRHGLGVLVSHTGGDSWEPLGPTSDVSRSPVATVEVDPEDSEWVYVGTYGRGVWRYHWAGALPACAE